MTDTNQRSDYIPGICNINSEEVAYRRKWRNIGFIAAAALFLFLYAIGTASFLRGLIFLPLFVGMIGYFQTKHRFCVSYGASGMQNATEGSKKASAVTAREGRLDKVFARKLNRKAALISLLVTFLLVLIPR